MFTDWVNMKYNPPLERAAAVTHLQTSVMLSSLLHAWLRNFRLKCISNPMTWGIEKTMIMSTQVFDAPEDIWALGGYHIMMADNGTFNDVNERHTAFSHMRSYLTMTTATQCAQGTTGATHIRDWDVPLRPQDGRVPSASGKPPEWDSEPIEMRPEFPDLGLTNVDADEGSTRIFDHTIMTHIIKYYQVYWNHRVERTTREYFEMMITNRDGRLDLDGICPYYCDNHGELKFPF